jgi:hypothetical protein
MDRHGRAGGLVLSGDEKWTAKMLKHDFRVGGGKRFTFGPPDQTFVKTATTSTPCPSGASVTR